MSSTPNQANPRAWKPSKEEIAATNIGHVIRELGLNSYEELYRWSIDDRSRYWQFVIDRLGICLDHPCAKLLDLTGGVSHPKWLVGAKMNIVNSCFAPSDNLPAVCWPGERGRSLKTITYGELAALANRVSNGLTNMGLKRGEAAAVMMPMNVEAVAIYLGLIQAGCPVVSIADSFAPDQIAMRLRIANVKLLFTQDFVTQAEKRHPLYERTTKAPGPASCPTVVLRALPDEPLTLRDADRTWQHFLSDDAKFVRVPCQPDDPINILFSSGTTGEPKAIPWDHSTPIKCAADGFFHHDIQRGDVTCWPTNLGWMMGPWLIFATMINRGTMALYNAAPTEAGFGRFVQAAKVNMLGVVPSLVRSWRNRGCMQGVDWSAIKLFSSTGECSNAQDMQFLMSLAGHRPVVEYCGGTEIGGGYITGTLVQPALPAAFSTPALGVSFAIVDDEGKQANKGELFIIGPSIGLSNRLLNRDHDKVYYANTPWDGSGVPLRRHGDQVERLGDGYYRVLGRADDTMNLGGIKIGSAEIERVLCSVEGVRETAAVAMAPPDGGPDQLIVFAVLEEGATIGTDHLQAQMQHAIRTQLNPLFKIHQVNLLDALPRTASNKIMRRKLRGE